MNRRARKYTMPEIVSPVKCRLVPIAEPLLPYFRHFFETMQSAGPWMTTEDAERAREYFSFQEAMMLCDLGFQMQQQQEAQDRNFCTLVSVLVMALTEGAIDPASAMALCNIVRSGLEGGEGSTEYAVAELGLSNLNTAGVGGNTNQMEGYQKVIAELIGGTGVVEDVD
jgi:hypothetical protein